MGMWRWIVIGMIVSLKVQGQESRIVLKGRITNVVGKPLPFSTIAISNSTSGTVTDAEGNYTIRVKKPGSYVLTLRNIGFEEKQIQVKVKAGETVVLNETLEESNLVIDAVVVSEKSGVTITREQAFTVSAIDAKPLQSQNLDVNQVLGRISGVRIREEGGMGSAFNFSLNGFKGKQVRFFLDGVPMDYFGSSLSLNNIPVNMISGIEVYKGVVPISLGTDALGGAVNVLTRQQKENYINASYSLGSFNSHRASVLGGIYNNNGFYARTSLFFNYSDNDYLMRNMEVVEFGGNGKAKEMDVRRFHDAYQSQSGSMELGIANKKFADQLSLGLTFSSNNNELQHGYNMQQVYGQVCIKDQVLMPTLKYTKSDLWVKGLKLSSNTMFIQRETDVVDTSSLEYNWLGETNPDNLDANHGEYSYFKTLLTYNDKVAYNSIHLHYQFTPHQSFALSNAFNFFSRQGVNPLVDEEDTPFYEPNILQKNISALSYQLNLFNNRLKTTLFCKYFYVHYHTIIEESEENEVFNTLYDKQEVSDGYGVATTYRFTSWAQVKLSYENTYRLPEGDEAFGDGLHVRPNTSLKPETSNNYNAGIILSKAFVNHKFRLETAYLYRQAKDYIRKDASEPKNSWYTNDESVQLTSFETEMEYHYKERFHCNTSITRQINTNTDKADILYGDYLPNEPLLFANANAGLHFKKVAGAGSELSFTWNMLFVDKFYWKWPSQGSASTKGFIPRQLVHDARVSLRLKNGRYSISGACTNLANSLVYDNFNMQKPGRAFNVKFSYFFSKTPNS